MSTSTIFKALVTLLLVVLFINAVVNLKLEIKIDRHHQPDQVTVTNVVWQTNTLTVTNEEIDVMMVITNVPDSWPYYIHTGLSPSITNIGIIAYPK